MKFKLIGYGTGAIEGKGVARQYKTLRGELDLSKTKFVEEWMGLGFSLQGNTNKTSLESVNNEVSITFEEASIEELLQLAHIVCNVALMRRRRTKRKCEDSTRRKYGILDYDEIDKDKRETVISSSKHLMIKAEQLHELCQADFNDHIRRPKTAS